MKKTKIPNIVAVMILTVVTISVWIVFSVVRIFQMEPTPSLPPEILNPLNSDYDKTAVDKIEKRLYFEQGQVFETPAPATSSGEINI